MGQITSKQSTAIKNSTESCSTPNIIEYFNVRCLKFFSNPELVAFERNLPGGMQLTNVIKEVDIANFYHIPKNNSLLLSVFGNMLRTLSNFPLVQDSYDPITYRTLLKAILLIDREKAVKYTGWKQYDQVKMLFISLSVDKSTKLAVSTPSSSASDVTTQSIKSLIHSYNSTDFNDLSVPAENLLVFFSFLLSLSRYSIINNCNINDDLIMSSFHEYEKYALSLIRTMNPKIDTFSDCLHNEVGFIQFQTTIRCIAPNILQPLVMLLKHILFTERDLIDNHMLREIKNPTKIVTEPLLAQLATILPKESIFTNFQKLYVGRESGFSMRSFQSKVFKWMAPTVLFVTGLRIVDGEEIVTKKNPRYRGFLEEFGRLHEAHIIPPLSPKKRKIILAVYINEPWKITNKDLFGDTNTKIIQLSPKQDIYNAEQSKLGNIYFNTAGGGIGIGNEQPIIKPNKKKYVPGNVSLTIDSSLEFAVFRHAGSGGTISPGILWQRDEHLHQPFEYRFLIQDIEVWGCGGEAELQEQLNQWKWEETEAKRRQKINLQSIGEERALLELAGLIQQQHNG